MVGLQALDPPARMVPARDRIAVSGRQQRFALAQEAAQAGVDEVGLGAGGGIALGGFHRLVDQGERLVVAVLRIPGQRQRGAQQRVGRRRRRPLGQQCLGPAQIAQCLEGQRLRRRPQGRVQPGQRRRGRFALANGGQNAGGSLQLPPEGNGSAVQPRVSVQMLRAQFMA